MTELHEEGIAFTCGGEIVPPGSVPFNYVGDLSLADIEEAELEENILRATLEWPEEVAARAKIHELRKQQNPLTTVRATATEIAEIKGTLPETERQGLQRALFLKDKLNDPRIRAAKTVTQAHKIALDDIELSYQAELVKRASTSAPVAHTLIHGDCRHELPKLADNLVDVILTDPPYGIDADTMKSDSKHHYDDSPDYALEICKTIIREGFRVAKSKAVLFMFCDIENFLTLREYARAQLWTPWRAPLVYYKGAIGHAPWGRAGFVRTHELILFAVKGKRELYQTGGPDVIHLDGTILKNKAHAAEKPIGLLEHLLKRATLPGNVILDPCCGSGPIFPAATALSLTAIGFEKDESYYNRSLVRLHNPLDEIAETTLTEAEDDFLDGLED